MKQSAVTAKYKKGNVKIKEKIDKEGVKFAKKAGILNRMQANGTNNCFVTLKDHKENFENNPTTRLINPAKNEIGRISKSILDKINANLNKALGINQWKNTAKVVSWFKSIVNKSNYTFTVFDIKEFYPSIKESLLGEAINFAKERTEITKNDIETIFHARKSLLFDHKTTWIKKTGGLFDVTMGAYDGAEVCELVGTFLLTLLSRKYNKNDIGLYRDDGLAVFKDMNGQRNKKLKRIFKRHSKKKVYLSKSNVTKR